MLPQKIELTIIGMLVSQRIAPPVKYVELLAIEQLVMVCVPPVKNNPPPPPLLDAAEL